MSGVYALRAEVALVDTHGAEMDQKILAPMYRAGAAILGTPIRPNSAK